MTPDGAPRLPRNLEYVRTLGQGGMGAVVLARDPDLGRLVAVKYVLDGGLVSDGVERMLREGRALAALRHPNVVPVYEAVRLGTDVALVMGYVQGSDLETLMTERPPEPAERLRLLSQLAGAVEAVHGVGIVHRDLKPPNVLVGVDGVVRVADFGLARFASEAGAFRTAEGLAWGTPFYAPPEQLTDPEHEHPAIDRWAYGVIAHRVLYGDLPPHPAVGGRVPAPFDAAIAVDPHARITPTELARRLAAEPLDRWPALTAGVQPDRSAPVTVRAPLTEVARSPSVLAGIEPRPSAVRRLLPLALGLLVGMVAALVWVLAR